MIECLARRRGRGRERGKGRGEKRGVFEAGSKVGREDYNCGEGSGQVSSEQKRSKG